MENLIPPKSLLIGLYLSAANNAAATSTNGEQKAPTEEGEIKEAAIPTEIPTSVTAEANSSKEEEEEK